jgi:non-canonical poly(A) RNA polymerase PAPD5/7
MNGNGEARFKDLESSDEAVIDLTQDTEEETDGVPRKRMKTTDQPSTEQSTVPKWSNPECYTALPPPENAGGPKKDIVQVIRKSKVDAASKANFSNAVSNNADFISFFDDDNDNDSDDADAEDDSMNDSSSASDSDDFPTKKAAASLASRQQRSEPKPPSQATNSQNRFAALPTAHNFQANDALEVPPPPPPPPRSQFERSDSPPPPPPPQGLIIPDDAELATMYGDGPKGTKRKRQEQSRGVGQLVSEWLGNGIDESPWFSGSHIAVEEAALMLEIGNHSFDKYSLTPFTSSLHKEIRDFYEFVRPWDHEEAVRNDLIARVEKTVRKAYKVNGAQTAQILSFGSFASGLYLPTADMDLVAVSPNYLSHGVKTVCQTKNKLFALSRYLTYSGIAAPDTVSPVVGAKVPIVKFTDSLTGIKVDISFENDSGLKATDTFEQWKTQYPAMPALVMVIKQFLAMRDLNEVFTGGLGGFSIICLVVNMLAMMPEVQSSSIDPRQHCGEMLLKFFDLYGNHFDVVKTGLTMNPPGYFEKARHNRKFSKDNQRLTILDPNNPENDISGGTANINIILNCFREARHAILRRLYEIREGKGDNESILGCIIGGNYSGVALQRDRLRKLHAGEAVGPLLNAPTKSSQQPAAPKPVKKQKPVHDSRPQFAPKMRTRRYVSSDFHSNYPLVQYYNLMSYIANASRTPANNLPIFACPFLLDEGQT